MYVRVRRLLAWCVGCAEPHGYGCVLDVLLNRGDVHEHVCVLECLRKERFGCDCWDGCREDAYAYMRVYRSI
jgi:hypothetical protein